MDKADRMRSFMWCLAGFALVIGSSTKAQPVRWERLPLEVTWLTTVAVDHAGRIFVAAYDGSGLYRSTDDGATWANAGLRHYSVPPGCISFNSSDDIFAGTTLGLFRSTDHGTTWEPADAAVPNKNVTGLFCGKQDELLLTVYVDRVGYETYRSSDGGISWACVLPQFGLFSIVEFGVGRLIGGSSKCVWGSSDHGRGWDSLSEFSDGRHLAKDDDGPLYAAGVGRFAGNFYRSLDTGFTWARAGNGLPAEPNHISSIVSPRPGHLFASFSNGQAVWASVNGGLDWSKSDAGLASTKVSWLAVDGGGRLLAATDGGGLCRSTTSVTAVAPQDGIPAMPALSQNYPNPFNPVTTIRFTIVDRRWTNVSVYDLLGRTVATLVDEVREPGTYEVTFDASNLASGVYLYQLQVRGSDLASPRDSRGGAGDWVQSRKLVIVR